MLKNVEFNNNNNLYRGSPYHESDIQWGPVDREEEKKTTLWRNWLFLSGLIVCFWKKKIRWLSFFFLAYGQLSLMWINVGLLELDH